MSMCNPVKTLLQEKSFLRSCKILWDLAGILQEPCLRFLLNPIRSHKILQECKKRTFSCNSCNISCKSAFTGKADRVYSNNTPGTCSHSRPFVSQKRCFVCNQLRYFARDCQVNKQDDNTKEDKKRIQIVN